MTLRKIAQIGHPVLRERAREVGGDELRSEAMQRFIDDLVETMRDASGAGLAANQVHKVLRGIAPGTIPVVSAESFFQLNYRVARELGLEVSAGLLRQANEVIR
ncbi:MAG: peptide deformylase [Sandaracinaceae bacterium]|nr:peptide deformylase [Sandaracinaceae bacterium]